MKNDHKQHVTTQNKFHCIAKHVVHTTSEVILSYVLKPTRSLNPG